MAVVDEIQKIVAELPELRTFTGVWAVADRRVAQGDGAFVADLGIALARTYGSDEQVKQYRSVVASLLQRLATTAGPENVTQALRLASAADVTSPKLDRFLASTLASSQDVTDLAGAFTGHASEELRACLVQELVLRGVVVDETPGIAGWATSPQWRHHPLGWLPRTLSDLESSANLPSYGARSSAYPIPHGMSTGSEQAVISGAPVPSSEETTTPAVAAAMADAVANWADESNGRIEARVFELAEPLDAASVPGALLTLGLECLQGAEEKDAASVAVQPPDRAWRVLFAAASAGGAYNAGAYGAYGRLAAWRSLAALAGSPEGDTVDEVEARVRDCSWFGFTADTEWFERVAWDIGLAALGPGHQRLAVLAATDTD